MFPLSFQAAGTYADPVSTPHPPKVEGRIPDLHWSLIWSRLNLKALPASAVDVAFSVLHNIHPLQVRHHQFNIVPSPTWPGFPPSPVENAVILAVVVFYALAWSSRATVSDLSPEAVRSAVDAAAATGPFPSIFSL
jgi:hypothetical protein